MIDVPHITRKRELLVPNNSEFSIHEHRGETIIGKKIEIGTGRACDNFYGCVFQDCEIRLKGSGSRTWGGTLDSVFQDCHIWASKVQNIATWEATFERCYFRGKYVTRFSGPMTDCDFSIVKLLSASFLQETSLGEVIWPTWPHIVIDNPSENYADWNELQKPEEFNIYNVWKTGIACVINLEDAVDDPETFWSQISDRPYVHTHRDGQK